jgi:C4-dicarboxylate transporter
MTMSSAVLTFGIIVLVLATYLIKKGKAPEAVLRIFGTILIIVIASFLVVAGYSDQQIAPVMGLLGTLAGYLLGKDTKENKEGKSDKADTNLSAS